MEKGALKAIWQWSGFCDVNRSELNWNLTWGPIQVPSSKILNRGILAAAGKGRNPSIKPRDQGKAVKELGSCNQNTHCLPNLNSFQGLISLKLGGAGKEPGIAGWSRDLKHPKIVSVINYDVTNVWNNFQAKMGELRDNVLVISHLGLVLNRFCFLSVLFA